MRRSVLGVLLALMLWPASSVGAQPQAPPVSRDDAEVAARAAWQAAAQMATARGGQLAGAQDAPSAKRIGDTTVLTDPAGLRLAVTVNAFEDNTASTNRYSDPPQGRWAVADWTIKNEGTTEIRVNRLHFKLQTADGYVIEREGSTVREPDLDTSRIGPGQVVRGWLAYDVPTGQIVKSLIYQPTGARQFVIAELP